MIAKTMIFMIEKISMIDRLFAMIATTMIGMIGIIMITEELIRLRVSLIVVKTFMITSIGLIASAMTIRRMNMICHALSRCLTSVMIAKTN